MPKVEDLEEALRDVVGFLASLPGRGVIIGGVAVAFTSRARVTRDIDATIFPKSESVQDILLAASTFQLEPRIADAGDFAKKHRIVLLKHAPTGVEVDISLGTFPFESEMIRRAEDHVLGDLHVPVARPEDLLVMKAIAHRKSDLLDIDTILTLRPELDRKEVLFNLAQFAAALDMPEIVDELKSIFRLRSDSSQQDVR